MKAARTAFSECYSSVPLGNPRDRGMLMSTRSVGLLLGLALIIAIGTLVQDFRFDSLIARERDTALAADREFGGIETSLASLRTAQAGYVALGQAPASWATRASELFTHIETLIAARRVASRLADADAQYGAVTQSLAALARIDGQARAAVQQEDRYPASDLVFMDAADAAGKVNEAVVKVRAAEAQASSDHTRRLAMLRLVMNGVAVMLVLIIAVYFGRAARVLGSRPPVTTAQMLKDLPPPVKSGAPSLSLSVSTAAASTPAPIAGPIAPAPSIAAPRSTNLAAAAELCVDLARVLDGRDVPALLERTATLFDAKGVVLWAADTDGALLRPTLCHGYPDKVLARLRPLQVDSDNVTSLAFRSLQPQSITGASANDAGAIAVPLITATGCVGVLAAEIRQSRPHPDLLPLARIVAAQFSTLVAPADTPVKKTVQA